MFQNFFLEVSNPLPRLQRLGPSHKRKRGGRRHMGSTDRVMMGCNETAKEDRNRNRCIIEGGGKIGRGRSWDRGRGTDPASLLRRRRRKVSGGREGGENESGPRFWTHTSPPPPFFERDIHSILPLCSIQLRPPQN